MVNGEIQGGIRIDNVSQHLFVALGVVLSLESDFECLVHVSGDVEGNRNCSRVECPPLEGIGLDGQ